MERYEHEWIDPRAYPKCAHCRVLKGLGDKSECPVRLRLALDAAIATAGRWEAEIAGHIQRRDAALAERADDHAMLVAALDERDAALAELVDVREKLHIETCAGEVSEHERDAALADAKAARTFRAVDRTHTEETFSAVLFALGAPDNPVLVVEAVAAVERLKRERDAALAERDLAIAHDRQPYPTAHGYEMVCAALQEAEAELRDQAHWRQSSAELVADAYGLKQAAEARAERAEADRDTYRDAACRWAAEVDTARRDAIEECFATVEATRTMDNLDDPWGHSLRALRALLAPEAQRPEEP